MMENMKMGKILKLIQPVWNELTALLMLPLNFLDVLFEQKKLARRFMLFWAIWMITDILFWFKENYIHLTNVHATVIGLVFGLLSTTILFYQWSRMRDKG